MFLLAHIEDSLLSKLDLFSCPSPMPFLFPFVIEDEAISRGMRWRMRQREGGTKDLNLWLHVLTLNNL